MSMQYDAFSEAWNILGQKIDRYHIAADVPLIMHDLLL